MIRGGRRGRRTAIGCGRGMRPGTRARIRVVATAVTPAAVDNPPSAPTGLSASASGSSGVNLSWTAATDDNGVSLVRGGAVSGGGLLGVRAGGDDGVDVVGGYGFGCVDELFVSGAGAGHGEPGRPVFECGFGDDRVRRRRRRRPWWRRTRLTRGRGRRWRICRGTAMRVRSGRRRGRRRASTGGA